MDIAKRAKQMRVEIKRDRTLYEGEKITHEEFWRRVHGRDAELKANPPLRKLVNG